MIGIAFRRASRIRRVGVGAAAGALWVIWVDARPPAVPGLWAGGAAPGVRVAAVAAGVADRALVVCPGSRGAAGGGRGGMGSMGGAFEGVARSAAVPVPLHGVCTGGGDKARVGRPALGWEVRGGRFPERVSAVVASQGAGAAAAGDSQRVRAAARAAQHEFERVRRDALPWTWDRWGGPCDEVIGRFCLWHDGDEDWEPPPEPEAVVVARERLIAELEEAVRRLPGDGWIAGQRVRYLLEAGRGPDALAAARSCGAERWWCAALEGYALHHGGEFAAGESAFAAAVRAMEPAERARWTDVSVLLEPGERGWYRRLGEGARRAFEERFWRLADPLYLVPGNDRRTEHYVRLVLDRLQEGARSPFGVPWGWDLREITVRYGWPAGWERVRPPPASATPAVSVVSHFRKGGRQFVPPAAFVRDPVAIEPGAWVLDLRRPRAEFAPPYAGAFEALEHQLAVFRRGDSAVVVAAYDLEAGDEGAGRPGAGEWAEAAGAARRTAAGMAPAGVEAALVLLDAEGVPVATARRAGAGPRGVLMATAPAEPLVVSLEVLARQARRAARARYGLPLAPMPRFVPGVSDLLLLDRPVPLPENLDDAGAMARGSTRVRSGERLGVFLELYELGARRQPASLVMSVVRGRKGWLRRAAERLALASDEPPLELRWTEEVGTAVGPFARSLAVDLPELAPGSYVLRLQVEFPGRSPLIAERGIQVQP